MKPAGHHLQPTQTNSRLPETDLAERIEAERGITAQALKPEYQHHLAEAVAAGISADLFHDDYCKRAWTAHFSGVDLLDIPQLQKAKLLGTEWHELKEDNGAVSGAFDKNLKTVVSFQLRDRRQSIADRLVAGYDLARVAMDVQALEKMGARPQALVAVSAANLCANPPPTPPELIHGMLYRGGTGMISAPSKGHKTYTMLDASAAIALGSTWLGFETTATPVLYVNLELSEHGTAKRLAAICSARGTKPPENLHILNLRGHHITVDTLHRVIVPMAKQLSAGLIVIDPYYKISAVSGVEENSNDGQAVFLAQVEAAARDAACAIIMVHHFAKGDSGAKNSIDRASGGGVLARWPDVIATLTEHETDDCMVAEFHLRDFAPIKPFVVRWVCPVWVCEDGEDPAKVKRAGAKDSHPASDLLTKLPAGGLSNAEWCKASGWSDGTYRRKRDELAKAGKVKNTMNIWFPC